MKDNKNKGQIKENKDIYELTKNEKNMYNSIKEKLKEFDIKYSNTGWLYTLNYNFYNKKGEDLNKGGNTNNKACLHSISISYESIDNYIRVNLKIILSNYLWNYLYALISWKIIVL